MSTDRIARGWTAFWFAAGSPHNLAAARIVIGAHALWLLLSRDLPAMSGLPEAFWAQVPRTTQWRYLLFHNQVALEFAIQGVAIAALVATVLGIRPRVTCLVAALALYHLAPLETIIWTGEPITRGFDISILALIVLSLSPCADVWSVPSALTAEPVRRAGWEYTWGLRLIQVFAVQVYLFSGWAKFAWTGIDWIAAENMRGYVLVSNLTTPVLFEGPGILLASSPLLLWAVAAGSVVFEFAFPLVLVSRMARYLLLPVALAFHVGILLTMNIAFPGVPRLLLFVNWAWLREHIPWRAAVAKRWRAASG